MASDVQQLRNAIAAAQNLSEHIRGDLLGVRQTVKQSRGGVIGPIAGSHAADEANAYLSQIDNHMVKAGEAAQALIARLKRMASQAGGI